MRILLIGHGRMGQLVESLAPEYGCDVAGFVDENSAPADGIESPRWAGVDVAIDFSEASGVAANAIALAWRGINLVIGTTGWQKDEPAVRAAIEKADTGAVVAANFSTGVVIFEAIAERAAQLFAARPEFGAFVHEAHHAAKKDAPSGTALTLQKAMVRGGYAAPIDVASTRAGQIPGTHTIGFDGPAETIVLSHIARDRSTFARGALTAANWIKGKRGWYSMRDVLGV